MRGRARTIKPELFSDEVLGDLEQATGVPVFRAFVGLLCFADREGRFEWAPRSLRGAILPCWDGDMRAALEALASKSYIVRYTVNGKDYGYIRNFAKHQTIHPKEAASVLPDPRAHGLSPIPNLFPETPEKDRDAIPEGSGRLEVEVEVEVGSEVEVARTRKTVPETWQPNEGHAARCQELGLELDETVRGFREQEFNRGYGDWDRRFSKWITDQRIRVESKRPPGRVKFRKDWKPKDPEHRVFARANGLDDREVHDLAEHCRNKLYPIAFDSEDEQFKREILWAKERKAKHATGRIDETPGRNRAAGDQRPPPVFGGIAGQRPR